MSQALAGRAPAVFRHGRRVPAALPFRHFSLAAASSPKHHPALQSAHARARLDQKRLFSSSALRRDAVAQPPPNPRAYLESGVIKPQEIVDVKKVLVIGSGGLAIGQAGEFDYSGESSPVLPSLSWCCRLLSWGERVWSRKVLRSFV